MLCLHPLQTFTGEPRAELLRDVPCAVTAHEERDLQLGEELARRLGMRPFRLADDKKTLYHLSAVVGCNLLVALESEAKRLMDEATGGDDGLDHLAPLLNTAMKNLLSSGDPARALTGPVARGDVGTVRAHLRLLDRESPRLARTYRALSLEALTLAAPRLDDEQVRTLKDLLAKGRPARRRRTRRDPMEARRDRRAHHRRDAGRAAQPAAAARLHSHHGRSPRGSPQPRGRRAGDAARPSPPRSSSTRRSLVRGEDLDRYPRDEARDLALFEDRGGRVWCSPPTPTRCTPRASRPACTSAARSPRPTRAPRAPATSTASALIVTKLLDVVQPDVLFLGEKDAQQLAVIRRLVRDLDLPVEVAGVPTVREPDGLAMSSRNAISRRSSAPWRPDLYRALAGRAGRRRQARRHGRRTSSSRPRRRC